MQTSQSPSSAKSALGTADSIPFTLHDAAGGLRDGSLTSSALTAACLARADELDQELGSYISRFDETAFEAAVRADADFAAGIDRGPLQGVPFGVKDFFATIDGPTTANSAVLDPEWGVGREGAAVARLRSVGAVITGKTTAMEFAAGMPEVDRPFPIPRNPWDLRRWAGGSSSGSANGVAAGLFLGAVGTDTGGSIRAPAAFCGITGLIPTYGRVPKSGLVPSGLTLDRVGPLARTARDCAAILQVLAGWDPTDHQSSREPAPSFLAAIDEGIEGLRIGVVDAFDDHSDSAARQRFGDAMATLSEMGATVSDVGLPYYDEVNCCLMATVLPELLAYHLPDLRTKLSDYFVSTRAGLLPGIFISGSDYVQAQRVRRVAQRAVAALFGSVDLVVMPTVTTVAPGFDQLDEDGLNSYMAVMKTQYWSVVGNPVIAVPIGFSDDGLPLSLQIAGNVFDEGTVLRAANAYQTVTDWHLRRPPLTSGVGT